MATTPAELFLREILSDGAEHLSTEVQAEAEARGFTWRSVERARAKMGDNLVSNQRGFRGPHVLRLTTAKPADVARVYTGWPEYTPVVCLTCGRTAGVYHQPKSTTCDRCAACTDRHNPLPLT